MSFPRLCGGLARACGRAAIGAAFPSPLTVVTKSLTRRGRRGHKRAAPIN